MLDLSANLVHFEQRLVRFVAGGREHLYSVGEVLRSLALPSLRHAIKDAQKLVEPLTVSVADAIAVQKNSNEAPPQTDEMYLNTLAVERRTAPVEWTTRDAIHSLPIARLAGSRSTKDRHRPEPPMSLPRTVAEILREHVTLEVEGIDRMYLNAYVPRLQYESGVAAFFRRHRGQPVASSALMDPISKGFVAAIHAFVEAHQVPLIAFEKGQRKDDVMAEHLKHFTASEGVVFVGRAQEKTPVLRTEKRRNPTTGQAYPWL